MAIIEVKNLGKKYNIGHRQGGYLTLRDVLTNVFKKPWLLFRKRVSKEGFWALKDVNFSIEKGEVVGIIGANGAGKSTLLKILSQITTPSEGEVRIEGRVGSLLEVGTGFHPELTGRENIFLNGAILGMSKKEIQKKFDEIVAFSGVEKFLETPVKYYSSGMYVRLAFAVAAHLEPDILIIDEVLAVGDAEFQKKCLGKMDDITKKEGRTILFVSHNMGAIRQLCQRCVLLEKGEVKMIGKTEEVIANYVDNGGLNQSIFDYEVGEKKVAITHIEILDDNLKPNNNLSSDKPFYIKARAFLQEDIKEANCFSVSVFDLEGDIIFQSFDVDNDDVFYKHRPAGEYEFIFSFPSDLFNHKTYKFNFGFGVQPKNSRLPEAYKYFDDKNNILINFYGPQSFVKKFFNGHRGGNVLLKISAQTKKIK